MTTQYREADPDECEESKLALDRRDFFRDAGLAVLGALVMVGVPPDLAATTHVFAKTQPETAPGPSPA